MAAVTSENVGLERRKFPRIKARCPVHYFTQVGGDWFEAELEDYSASGICIVADETLMQATEVTIRIMRNAKVTVPPMTAYAQVVRCDINDDHRYKIACKLTRVRRENNLEGNRITSNVPCRSSRVRNIIISPLDVWLRRDVWRTPATVTR